MGRVGDGPEPLGGDRLLTFLAPAEGSLVDAPQCGLDLHEDPPFVLQEAQGNLLLKAVGTEIGEVERQVGQVAAVVSSGLAQSLIMNLGEVMAQPQA
jgi:hypothetical protein